MNERNQINEGTVKLLPRPIVLPVAPTLPHREQEHTNDQVDAAAKQMCGIKRGTQGSVKAISLRSHPLALPLEQFRNGDAEGVRNPHQRAYRGVPSRILEQLGWNSISAARRRKRWQSAALNDENMLIIEYPAVAAAYGRYFDGLLTKSPEAWCTAGATLIPLSGAPMHRLRNIKS